MKGGIGMSLYEKKRGTRRCLDRDRKSLPYPYIFVYVLYMQLFCCLWVLGDAILRTRLDELITVIK